MKMKNQTIFKSRANLLEAQASESNPLLGWLEFVLTDASPNKNNQGVPKEAFSSLINTGMYMPLKIAEVGEELEHDNSYPLGPISNLKEEGDAIIGKAALWKGERESSYQMLKDKSSKGESIDISWEILFTESSVDEAGVEWIKDPILKAATIVDHPAYGGRTPVVSVASTTGDGEDTNMEELEQLRGQISQLETDKTALETELADLRLYKENREKEDANATLLKTRLDQLGSAGLTYSDEEIEQSKELWLGLDDASFSALVNLLKKSIKTEASAETIPDLTGSVSANDLVSVVREGLKKL